jgi:hypothetical protein
MLDTNHYLSADTRTMKKTCIDRVTKPYPCQHKAKWKRARMYGRLMGEKGRGHYQRNESHLFPSGSTCGNTRLPGEGMIVRNCTFNLSLIPN